MKAVFVAGTDTGVGKTVVTGLLARYLSNKGYRVVTQKWVQTGCPGSSRDIDTHLGFTGKSKVDLAGYEKAMEPYSFRFPGSPHLSSRLEKRVIRSSHIRGAFKELSKDFDFIIAEGSGGLMVPFDKTRLMIDLVRSMRLPVVLVAGNRLGAINSTLLSVEALRRRGMKLCGVVFNENEKGVNKMILKDNPVIVRSVTGVTVLGSLPNMSARKALYKRFVPIGRKIESAL